MPDARFLRNNQKQDLPAWGQVQAGAVIRCLDEPNACISHLDTCAFHGTKVFIFCLVSFVYCCASPASQYGTTESQATEGIKIMINKPDDILSVCLKRVSLDRCRVCHGTQNKKWKRARVKVARGLNVCAVAFVPAACNMHKRHSIQHPQHIYHTMYIFLKPLSPP